MSNKAALCSKAVVVPLQHASCAWLFPVAVAGGGSVTSAAVCARRYHMPFGLSVRNNTSLFAGSPVRNTLPPAFQVCIHNSSISNWFLKGCAVLHRWHFFPEFFGFLPLPK